MKLKSYKHHIPVLIEGESSMATQSFTLGGTMGPATIESIEATPLGILVRRSGQFSDVLLTQFGWGIPEQKQSQQPQQLQKGHQR